ncbi:glycosyltransferase [Candidatus Woesebacteria bacterium]|nr:glycosyltransferase [Candidatus Woesebacteria bacterium]
MVVKNNFLSSDSSVLFATFSLWTGGKRMPTNGSVEPLRDFLVPRIRRLVLIDQLAPGSEDVFHKIEVYTEHSKKFQPFKPSILFYVLWPFLKFKNYTGTHVIFKVRDFISIIDWVLRDRKVFDYFIGLESVNACVGILLRRMGMVKHVVYYVSDYSPSRYKHWWFNQLYLWLDRYSAKNADYIWDVSRAIHPARIKAGLRLHASAPVIHVANGLFPEQIKQNPLSKIDPHALVFMGTLGPENGPDVAIRALAIVRKNIPDATLHIIGGTTASSAWLLPIVREHHQESSVIFHGFVPSAKAMSAIMRKCAVAVAPYRAVAGSPRFYGDAGKIRAYCASGLPIVSSRVPPIARDVEAKGAAIVTGDDEKSFAKAINAILNNKRVFVKMRQCAITIAKTNTWDHQFSYAFEQMQH